MVWNSAVSQKPTSGMSVRQYSSERRNGDHDRGEATRTKRRPVSGSRCLVDAPAPATVGSSPARVTPQYTPHALMMTEAATSATPTPVARRAASRAMPSVTRTSAKGAKSLLKR